MEKEGTQSTSWWYSPAICSRLSEPEWKMHLMYLQNTSGFTYNSSVVKKLVDEAYEIFLDEEIEQFNGTMADYFYPK